jgi:hypothetical protein
MGIPDSIEDSGPCYGSFLMNVRSTRSLLFGVALIPAILLLSLSGLSSAPPNCGYTLKEQKQNTLYPYKVERNGSFVAFITIQDSGGSKVISIGGTWFKYNPKSGSFSHAEKKLGVKPKNLEDAVMQAFKVYSKEKCY